MTKCKFCKSDVNITRNNIADKFHVECPCCGYYQITGTAQEYNPKLSDPEDVILFSGYLRNNSSEENPQLITSDIMNDMESLIAPYKRLSVIDKINLFLRYLGESSKSLGDAVEINDETIYTKFYCRDSAELVNMWNYLEESGLSGDRAYPMCSLSVEGWQAFEKLKEVNVESKKVFIAMSFDLPLNAIHAAIVEACDVCGFKGFRVDSEDHTDKICDKIIVDIKESRFVIADFTQQKAGVYFEAGFARGLGLKVIWTCKDEEKDNLHFDIRQYNFIFWKNPEDLRKRLEDRIKAVIK